MFKKRYLLIVSIFAINMAAMDGLTQEQLDSLWDIVPINTINLNSIENENAYNISKDYAISNDNLSVYGADGTGLYYFNVETLQYKNTTFNSPILDFIFTPNNKYIICIFENSEIIIWDIENWNIHKSININAKSIKYVMCPTNEYFVIITQQDIVYIIDFESGNIINQTKPISKKTHYKKIYFSPDNQYFGLYDSLNRISAIWPINCEAPTICKGELICFSNDSKWIFIQQKNNRHLFCQNLETSYVNIFKFKNKLIKVISKNNKLIIATSNDDINEVKIYLYDIVTLETKEIFSIHAESLSSLNFNLIGDKLFIISDHSLIILDVDTMQLLSTINIENHMNSIVRLNNTFINYIYTDNENNTHLIIYKIINPYELTQEQQILLYKLKCNPKFLILNEEQKKVFTTLPWYIKKLYVRKIGLEYLKDEKNKDCAICKNENINIVTTCCGQRFHLRCLTSLSQNNTCPICQTDLSK